VPYTLELRRVDTDAPRRGDASDLANADFPGYAMGVAAASIGVTPAFLRSAEAAGLFEAHRSDGGHRRYSREDLQRADRARELLDDGLPMDAAVRIVLLEYQLAAAEAVIRTLRGKGHRAEGGAGPPASG
jgi:MerR family transcriptional regulator/heat shock protein HspR